VLALERRFETWLDVLIGVWRPTTSEKPARRCDVAGRLYQTDELLMKMIKWKDREGAANVPFAFPFDMVTLKRGIMDDKLYGYFCPLCGT